MSENTNKITIMEVGRKRKVIILISLLIVGIAISGITLGFFFTGRLTDPDARINWYAEKGDIFYLSIHDNYYWTEDAEMNFTSPKDRIIREFEMVMKNEILDKKPLAIEQDDQDDLLIMSSFLFGRDDLFGLEAPNYFDFTNLLIMAYNLIELLSHDIILDDVINLWTPAEPIAIHPVTSGVHFEIQRMARLLGLEDLDHVDLGEDFGSMVVNLLLFLQGIQEQMGMFEEDFEGLEGLGGVGYDINEFRFNRLDNWTYTTAHPSNNSAYLFERDHKWGIMTFQDANASLLDQDDLTVTANVHSTFIEHANWEDYVLPYTRLQDTIYIPSHISFLLDYGYKWNYTDDLHVFEFGMFGNEFDMSGKVGTTERNFTGNNGIYFRFNNGILEHKVGDYVYFEAEGEDPLIPNIVPTGLWMEVDEMSKGWHEVTHHNFTELYNIESNRGSLMRITLTPRLQDPMSAIQSIFQNIMAFFTGAPPTLTAPYTYEITIESVEGDDDYYNSFSDIPLYIDCPFDFLGAIDRETSESFIFRLANMSNLHFKTYNSTSFDSECDYKDYKDYFTNVSIGGMLMDKDYDFHNLADQYVYSHLMFLSVFHLLFFPMEFNWDTVSSLVFLMDSLLSIVGEFVGAEDIGLEILDTEDVLRIEIPYTTLSAVFDLLMMLILGQLDEMIGVGEKQVIFHQYPCEREFKVVLTFDKRIGTMNQSYIEIHYIEWNIMRQVGMTLAGVADARGMAKYEDLYPSQPPVTYIDQVIEQVVAIALTSLIITAVISIASSISLVELVHYIRKRRRRSRDVIP